MGIEVKISHFFCWQIKAKLMAELIVTAMLMPDSKNNANKYLSAEARAKFL